MLKSSCLEVLETIFRRNSEGLNEISFGSLVKSQLCWNQTLQLELVGNKMDKIVLWRCLTVGAGSEIEGMWKLKRFNLYHIQEISLKREM